MPNEKTSNSSTSESHDNVIEKYTFTIFEDLNSANLVNSFYKGKFGTKYSRIEQVKFM